jgi:hypothetical protein
MVQVGAFLHIGDVHTFAFPKMANRLPHNALLDNSVRRRRD